MSVGWKNRIVGHGKIATQDVLFNPNNWRIHPLEQQKALAATLTLVGFVRSVTINTTTGNLVDGHMRAVLADQMGQEELDAEYITVSEAEERELLATMDPIAELASMDELAFGALYESIQTSDDEVRALLLDIAERGMPVDEMPPEETGAHHMPSGSEGAADPDSEGFKHINLVLTEAEYEELRGQLDELQDRWGTTTAGAVLRAVEDAGISGDTATDEDQSGGA